MLIVCAENSANTHHKYKNTEKIQRIVDAMYGNNWRQYSIHVDKPDCYLYIMLHYFQIIW